MWVADMDFASPQPVIDALKARVNHGVFGYTEPYAAVVEAVQNYLLNTHKFECRKEWIVWLPGLVPALNLICKAFEGSVMMNTPIYPPFLTAPAHADRPQHRVPLSWDGSQWTLDWAAMEEAVEPQTRVFLLCNPHNPVGRVYRRKELEQLAEFALRHDLIIASDEIHCDLILDPGLEHIPFLNLAPEVQERTIALYAPSKTYNLPGLACSFAVIPNARLRAAFKRVARGVITEINAMGYTACDAAYRYGAPWLADLIQQLRRNRDFTVSFLSEHTPEITHYPVEATYLSWMDVRTLGLENPAAFFESHGIGLSDGAHFGTEGFLRLNFGCPPSLLQEGLNRLKSAVEHAR
jgi:cystathionine beta-lyase